MPREIGPYNISEKYGYQWIAPERTGSRKVAEVLSFFGFTNSNNRVFLENVYHYTHGVFFDEKVKDYKLICNARNPYSKTVAIFRNLYNIEYRDGNKEQFRKYVHEDLKKGKSLKMIQNPILNKKIDHVIRLENISEDFKKIPFVLEKFTSTQLDNLVSHGKQLFPWEDFYDQELKDIVYGYTSHLFEMWGYEK